MWFKRVLLGHCAASLAVTFVAASIAKDVVVPRKQHTVERLVYHSLERRQQSFQNQTSSSQRIESASSVAPPSTFLSSEVPQTSTIITTPSIVITLTPSSPTPTSSTTEPSSFPSDNHVTPLISKTINTDSFTPSSFSSGAEQRSSETSVFISTQAATSPGTSPSTTIDTTYVVSSHTEGSHLSSTSNIPSSAFTAISDGTPTTSSEATSSSESMTVASVTSILIPTAGSPQSSSDGLVITSSGSILRSVAAKTETSAVLIPISQNTVTESSSIVTSASTPVTTPILALPTSSMEQQSIMPSTSSSVSTSDRTSNAGVPESTTSSPVGSSSSLLPEPFSTTSNEPTLGSMFPSTLPSPGSLQISSSTTQEILSTLGPEASTFVASNSDLSSMLFQTVTPSAVVQSSPTSAIIESGPSSITSLATNTVEISQPSLSPIMPETTLVLTTSAVQIPSSLSSQLSLMSSLTVSMSASNKFVSTLDPPVGPSSQATYIPSSTVAISVSTASSGDQIPNSSLSESTSVINGVSSMKTLSAALSNTVSSIAISSSAQPNSDFSSIAVHTGPLSSEFLAPVSSTLVVPTGPGAHSFTGLSQGHTPTITTGPYVDSSTSTATSFAVVVTRSSSLTTQPMSSLGTSILATGTSATVTRSSLAPSETNFVSTTSLLEISSERSSKAPQPQSSGTSQLSGTQPSISEGSSKATSNMQQSATSMPVASESKVLHNQTSNTLVLIPVSISHSLFSSSTPNAPSFASGTQVLTTTSIVASASSETYTRSTIPASEVSSGSDTVSSSSRIHSSVKPTLSGTSRIASSSTSISMSQVGSPSPPPVASNSTQTGPVASTSSRIITATFSTVYLSSIRSGVIDLSTVAFSLLNPVTGAAINQTSSLVSSTRSTIYPSTTSKMQVPASETLQSFNRPSISTNATGSLSTQLPPSVSIGRPGQPNNSTSSATDLGITFSRSALPSGTATGIASSLNATQAETLQTSSGLDHVGYSSAETATSITLSSDSRAQTGSFSSTSASGSEAETKTDGTDTGPTNTSESPHAPTGTPSQTAAAGNPPPLTTSQTAGVAVGGTTFLLIAVVAAIFIGRRYHAAKNGKRMSTGSVYPKVAYLYDPKTGGDGGDAEALMSGGTGGMPPGGPASRTIQGSTNQMQRHSMGAMSFNRFTNPGNPFSRSSRNPAIHRFSESEYAQMDTAKALSAAVAGYAGTPRRSSSYTKYPSRTSNPFSDHVIPSPTFAPFSPDDIRRPELDGSQGARDGRGAYSQVSVDSYAYLNTAASMYPPISPYGRPPSQGPSPTSNTRRHTIDSNPFADPFEHDLLLQVDERNRTSDSVTIFAPSPNLRSPHTPRTPVGPKLPVRQPNGMNSARSLLSPVAAKYMHKAQEVKIPRKSIASPVLVQVGRSPVIKPFSPPPAAPEPLGWADIKRHSEKRFSDERSVPAPLKFASPVIKKREVPSQHTRTKPSLTGAGQALPASNGLPLTVKIPHRYSKSVGLDVPRVQGNPNLVSEDMSHDPIVREKRSRELRFAHPSLIGKEF